jgi:hypothetical protein
MFDRDIVTVLPAIEARALLSPRQMAGALERLRPLTLKRQGVGRRAIAASVLAVVGHLEKAEVVVPGRLLGWLTIYCCVRSDVALQLSRFRLPPWRSGLGQEHRIEAIDLRRLNRAVSSRSQSRPSTAEFDRPTDNDKASGLRQ